MVNRIRRGEQRNTTTIRVPTEEIQRSGPCTERFDETKTVRILRLLHRCSDTTCADVERRVVRFDGARSGVNEIVKVGRTPIPKSPTAVHFVVSAGRIRLIPDFPVPHATTTCRTSSVTTPPVIVVHDRVDKHINKRRVIVGRAVRRQPATHHAPARAETKIWLQPSVDDACEVGVTGSPVVT